MQGKAGEAGETGETGEQGKDGRGSGRRGRGGEYRQCVSGVENEEARSKVSVVAMGAAHTHTDHNTHAGTGHTLCTLHYTLHTPSPRTKHAPRRTPTATPPYRLCGWCAPGVYLRRAHHPAPTAAPAARAAARVAAPAAGERRCPLLSPGHHRHRHRRAPSWRWARQPYPGPFLQRAPSPSTVSTLHPPLPSSAAFPPAPAPPPRVPPLLP